jgi:hypothetical protein
MTHICNPNYPKAEIGKMVVWGQAGKKVSKNPFKQTSWEWWVVTVILATQEAIAGGL